jgi:hypothetical protein
MEGGTGGDICCAGRDARIRLVRVSDTVTLRFVHSEARNNGMKRSPDYKSPQCWRATGPVTTGSVEGLGH